MNVKKELKDWEKEFEGKNGRQPNNEDKMPMSERYIAYKMVSRLCFVDFPYLLPFVIDSIDLQSSARGEGFGESK